MVGESYGAEDGGGSGVGGVVRTLFDGGGSRWGAWIDAAQ
jgi:hypothetical protein